MLQVQCAFERSLKAGDEYLFSRRLIVHIDCCCEGNKQAGILSGLGCCWIAVYIIKAISKPVNKSLGCVVNTNLLQSSRIPFSLHCGLK